MSTEWTHAPNELSAAAVIANGQSGDGRDAVRIGKALYERYLLFDKVVRPATATPRERFAAEVSNQISTAGFEASGTSNMKFMINGALTMGTRDGATIEMAGEAGEENFFIFGLTAEQVAGSRGWYNPHWHYEHDAETRAALDLIGSGHFSAADPELFGPVYDTLMKTDYYMHLADLGAYLEADQRLLNLYANPREWARKAVLNVASSGKFSSDRTIAEYAKEIWGDGMPGP